MFRAELFGGAAMRRLFIFFSTLLLSSTALAAQQPAWQPPANRPTINLWPSAVPGAPANSAPETDISTSTDTLIAGRRLVRLGNVSKPTLTFCRSGKLRRCHRRFSPEVPITFLPSISRAPKFAIGSSRSTSTAFW
jgi:hypothetical protein